MVIRPTASLPKLDQFVLREGLAFDEFAREKKNRIGIKIVDESG